MKALVTGAAGFIGFHVSKRLLERGDSVVGLDNLNAYYDVKLKEARLDCLRPLRGFEFVRADTADRAAMEKVWDGRRFDGIVHLAGQAGVRYSIEGPRGFVDCDVVGFTNNLEGERHHCTGYHVLGSTSSVT